MRKLALNTMMAAGLAVLPVMAQSGADRPASGSMSDPTTTTRMTDNELNDRDDDFDLGWLGLVGLAGLAGLMRKNRNHVVADHQSHRSDIHDDVRRDRF